MNVDQFISPLVERQFPSFYSVEGPDFILFVKTYYEWLEQEGYPLNAITNLLNYRDIDETLDQFLDHFRNEYLLGFPSITALNRRMMVKKIKDFYTAKGSTQGLQLLFRILFDDDIEVYQPGKDVLRASDGVWKVPKYIEVEHNPKSQELLDQQITGSTSGATAFVESVYTTIVNKRLIDVLLLSSIVGAFEYGELVTADGQFFEAPKVIGSLTNIDIVDGGANNAIGDLFEIISSDSGKYGQARVVAVVDGTGRVTFKLISGGTGYANTIPNEVLISNSVMFSNNVTNANTSANVFIQFETVRMPLAKIDWSVTTPASNISITLLQNVTGWAAGVNVASGFIVANPVANTIIVNVLTGNIAAATSIGTPANAILFTGYAYTNVTASGIVTDSNAAAFGVHSITNNFYGNGAFLVGQSSNTYANIRSVSTGSGANFTIGSIINPETVSLFTDIVSSNNVAGVEWLDMILSGSNSNTGLFNGTGTITMNTVSQNAVGVGTLFNSELIVGSGLYNSSNAFLGTVNAITNATHVQLSSNSLANVSGAAYNFNIGQYGFPKNQAAYYGSIVTDALTFANFTIGTIASFGGVNPGSDYNAPPFVVLWNPYIAAFNRRNLLLEVTNKIGVFANGDSITQNIITASPTLGYDANVGAFIVGEGVTQNSSSASATVLSINSTVITLQDKIGTFVANSSGGTNVRGLSSNSTANITAVSSASTASIAKGFIRNVTTGNTTIIEISRASFNEDFITGTPIGSSSGGTANLLHITQNAASLPMGLNADVTANVETASGIASELQVIYSGIGHQPGDNLVLHNGNNLFEISGTANVLNQGIGLGFWEDNRGKLNSDKYLHDNFYYQEFSYEVRTKLSLDKYADVLKQIAHTVGTQMFGRVVIQTGGGTSTISGGATLVQNSVFGQLDFRYESQSGYVAVLAL